jgi:hypothetical protein
MLKLAPLAVLALKWAARVFILQTTHLVWTMEVGNVDIGEVSMSSLDLFSETL